MFIIMCRVSGGITGTREGPLKNEGRIRRFADKDEAQELADELSDRYNGNPHRHADFKYWVVADPDYDPSPWCSYGHRTEADCDCGPIADND